MTILMALYKQLNISVALEAAEAINAARIKLGASVPTEFSAFIAACIGALTGLAAFDSKHAAGYCFRAMRHHHVSAIVAMLETIKRYEDAYRADIPDCLHSAPAYDDAVQAIDTLEHAINLLKIAY